MCEKKDEGAVPTLFQSCCSNGWQMLEPSPLGRFSIVWWHRCHAVSTLSFSKASRLGMAVAVVLEACSTLMPVQASARTVETLDRAEQQNMAMGFTYEVVTPLLDFRRAGTTLLRDLRPMGNVH